MNRPMNLHGWYPFNAEECTKQIEKHVDKYKQFEGDESPISAVVPHAGWYYSGRLAVTTLKLLKEKNESVYNVVIFGGHLAHLNVPILETYENAETPYGKLRNDPEIVEYLLKNTDIQPMEYLQDNTIEVLLPIVHYFFGGVNVTTLYLPPHKKVVKRVTETLYQKLPENTVYIGSTDLTHYGPNYNLTDVKKGMSAIDWVKNVNDKKFIDLLINMKVDDSIDHALENHAACSSGASGAACNIGKLAGKQTGQLVGYYTSFDIQRSENFVGYAGILF